MYYHTQALLGIEITQRLDAMEKSLILDEMSIVDGGQLSLKDEIKDFHLTKSRVMKYVNNLIGKSQLISITEISKTLNMAEQLIINILESEGLDIVCDESEDDY